MNLIVLLGTLILVGCGQTSSLTSKSKDRYVDSSYGTPVELVASDVSCEHSDTEFDYPLIFKYELKKTLYQVLGTKPYEHYPFINNVEIQGEFKKIYDIEFENEGTIYGKYKEQELQSSKALKVCPNVVYPYYSYQDASLKVMMALANTHSNLVKHLGKISPVSLKIAPIIHNEYIRREGKDRVHRKKTLVNNALYNRKEKQIIFLPVGINEEGIAPFNGVPFWEVPLIGAHEYGHHIFNEIVGNITSQESDLCFDNRQKIETVNKDEGRREVTTVTILSVLDEAAADLVAYYALDKKFHNLHVLNCLALNREVDRNIWKNQKEKIFDDETLDKFFSKTKKTIISCFFQVDYQDTHILGANIANLFYSLFDSLQLTREQSLSYILKWFEKIKLQRSTSKKASNRELLVDATQLMLTMLAPSFQDKKIDLCRLLDKRAPALTIKNSCN